MSKPTKSLGQKDYLDRFYTKETVSKKCISLVKECYNNFSLIIEPSAGKGSFSNNIENCLAFDIEPASENIKKENWLLMNKDLFSKHKDILVIGNPPFGQQNNLAIKFFNESAKIANVIAFILPKSFKKDSVKNRLDLNFHLIKEIDLPSNSFEFENETVDVPCVFQIWEKKEEQREKIKLPTKTEYFTFTSKDDSEIRIQRVGGTAGKASLDLNRAESSNYFIKNNTKMTNEEFVNFVNSLKFPTIEFTVGPKSLSKGELISIFEENIES